eukprot:g65786.t1
MKCIRSGPPFDTTSFEFIRPRNFLHNLLHHVAFVCHRTNESSVGTLASLKQDGRIYPYRQRLDWPPGGGPRRLERCHDVLLFQA